MIVGVCTVELFIPEGRSLKGKRQVLQSLKNRLREKFNVSVAEVGEQDDANPYGPASDVEDQ